MPLVWYSLKTRGVFLIPYIEPELLAEARKIDLLTYLETYEPQELERICNGVYRMKSYHRLKISNGKWMDWGEMQGGVSVVDFLIKIRKMSLPEAVEQIMGRAAIQPPFFAPQIQDKPRKFVLPAPWGNCVKVETYLAGRGIGREIIRYFVDTGKIYESHYKGYVNAVFVGQNKNGVARYASLRGVDGDFKGEVAGSSKRHSFSHSTDSVSLHLFEAAIGLAIIDYLKFGRPKCDNQNIFIKHNPTNHPCTASGMYNLVSNRLSRAGIVTGERKRGPHALRHSLASRLLEENVPLPVISEILGHANSNTTATYLAIDIDKLRQCALEVQL